MESNGPGGGHHIGGHCIILGFSVNLQAMKDLDRHVTMVGVFIIVAVFVVAFWITLILIKTING